MTKAEFKTLIDTFGRTDWNYFNNAMSKALTPTAQEIEAEKLARFLKIKKAVEIYLKITIPEDVTVLEVKEFLSTWIDDNAEKLKIAVKIDTFKTDQIAIIKEMPGGETVDNYIIRFHQVLSKFANIVQLSGNQTNAS